MILPESVKKCWNIGFSENSQIVLSPGEVVRTETVKKLSEVFKIKDYIDVMVINKNEK